MNSWVLDSSAVLALLQAEPGADKVRPVLPEACICAVNAAEVISKLCEPRKDRAGISPAEATATFKTLESFGLEVIAFDLDQACLAGELRPATQPFGLSLGDRACLGLARQMGLGVMTTDAVWRNLPDFQVTVIR